MEQPRRPKMWEEVLEEILPLFDLTPLQCSNTYCVVVLRRCLNSVAVLLIRWPLSFLWYIWITLPYILVKTLWDFTLFYSLIIISSLRSWVRSPHFLGVGSVIIFPEFGRRSSHARRIYEISEELVEILWHGWQNFKKMSTFELCVVLFQTLHEVILSWCAPSSSIQEKGLSYAELSDLLFYEEFETDHDNNYNNSDKQRQYNNNCMPIFKHSSVPPNPFRATIRIHRTDVKPDVNDISSASASRDASISNPYENRLSSIYIDDADSPSSLPGTPYTRAQVMNRSAEKVCSVMFAARDRLRVEAQSVSNDAYSRIVAEEARKKGEYAVFDPKELCDGLVLKCGNHCILKVSKSLCSSCRSMTPIWRNTMVYFEFSISASQLQAPSLAIGLSSSACPLNVMVGSWPCSIGLYSDGQLIADSHWFHSTEKCQLMAGATVGMLVYLPDLDDKAINAKNEITANCTQNVDRHDGVGCNYDASCWLASSVPKFQYSINGVPVCFNNFDDDDIVRKLCAAESVYPTVSILSQGTRVWCRFCEADMVYRRREQIGAPPGCKVYCLDGSLLCAE